MNHWVSEKREVIFLFVPVFFWTEDMLSSHLSLYCYVYCALTPTHCRVMLYVRQMVMGCLLTSILLLDAWTQQSPANFNKI